MEIAGLQKLTLLDYPGITACTVFVAGCDFACPFCQNASLIAGGRPGDVKQGDGSSASSVTKGDGTILAQTDGTVATMLSLCAKIVPSPFVTEEPSPCFTISEKEVLDFLKTRQGLLDGVCISGGEPLLQDGLESFIDKVKDLGFLVKIDTNGSNPGKLRKLIESGKVDFVAMDIKNSPEKYALTIGLPDYDIAPIDESIKLLRTNAIPYEFRTTVVKEFHTEKDLIDIARWITARQGRQGDGSSVFPENKTDEPSPCLAPLLHINYFLQKFIDSESVKQKGFHSYSDKEMQQLITAVKTVLPTAELRGV